MKRRPRWFAPEVVQTSSMDCGPASLKCLLEGFGVSVSYGRLREACQTSVDGTSIDTLEDVARQLGLEAEQVMIPPDHLLLSESGALPAIVVIELPSGDTHFVVVWKRIGNLVQVMDPARGRSFMTTARLLGELFVHRMAVPAESFREFALTEDFTRPLARRLADLGGGTALLDRARADESARTMVTLDAAVRMTEALAEAGAIDRGAPAANLVAALIESELARPPMDPVANEYEEVPGAIIPAGYWTVRAAPPEDDVPRVWLRGAVLVSIKGVRPDLDRAALSPELSQALAEPPARPARLLWSLVREDGLLAPAALLAAMTIAGGAAFIEALLLRGLFDVAFHLGTLRQRLGASIALTVFLAALLAIDLTIAGGLARLGRLLEVRLRLAFLRKIPRLGDRYFQSRPTSDMVQRVHAVQALRALPALGGQVVRSVLDLVVTTAGLIWLDPRGAPIVLAVAAISVALPLALAPLISERDMRVRTHAGALSRFYLDALLGILPLRAHSAERALRREHEVTLAHGMSAGLDLLRTATLVDAAQALAGFACAAALVSGYLARASDPAGVLLLLYWSLNMPAIGEQIALAARRYPGQRNMVLRLLEPLGAIEEKEPATAAAEEPPVRRPAAVQMRGVRVMAAGHAILEQLDLTLAPGEHVAVVGPSGAGKSSLVGLLLGWHRPEEGALLVDGAPLDGARLAALRRDTVWVDPAVQLWNRSLHDNLRYGAEAEGAPLMTVIEQADLRALLELLPEGLATPLGEGGARVSGGEGQRVRFGRAIHRGPARLVILDEPFRGLDRERRRRLLARSREIWRDATMIAVTHDVGETRAFPRVIVIDGGRVVEDGPPDLLAREGTRYRALLDAEDAVREGLWSGASWRRLQLGRGRLEEDGAR